MYDIGKFYQTVDAEDAMRVLMGNPEAVVISEGSDVLIKVREGKLAGCSLVSIHRTRELKGIGMEEDGTIVIGPATTFSHITNNDIIQKHIPMLGDAVDMVGSLQLRSIGTIGGNVCNGVTNADSASNLCYLDTALALKGPDGVRGVPINQWYIGSGRTARSRDEVLTTIWIRKENYQDYDGQYIRYDRKSAMETVTLGCTVNVKLTEDRKHIQDPRLAYGVAASTPIRCHMTEEATKGMETGEALAQAMGGGALEEVNPCSSRRAPREFRLQLVEELGRRVVKQAVINTGDGWDA